MFEKEKDERTMFDWKLGDHFLRNDEQLGSFHLMAENLEDVKISPHRFFFILTFGLS